jgi:ankyrin repeat protein
MGATQMPAQEQVEPFVQAAHGDAATVKRLLAENPALLNAVWEKFSETALQAASHMGRREIAEHLLAAGAPLDICAAAMLGQTEQVAAFLEADTSLATATGAHGIPVLFHAALSGKTEIGELLLTHGGGEGMDVALHGAVQPGHLAMTRWLLDHGASPNAPNYEGKTPLRVAVERGHDEIASLLRERGGREE